MNESSISHQIREKPPHLEKSNRTTQAQMQFVGISSAILPYLEDPEITDILINGIESLYYEKKAELIAAPPLFSTQHEIQEFVERLVIPAGKRLDALRPYMDGALIDGSRFHIISSPIAHPGPLISIRKFKDRSHIGIENFSDPESIHLLLDAYKGAKNILIAGATSSGKTTFLSSLLDLTPLDERILIIEETREILTTHPHAVFLESRPISPEGLGEVTLRTLVKNALRMRPSRIILGECRGGEAFDFLQALNTGHTGSLMTIHANSGLDALKRLETLTLLSELSLPSRLIKEWISTSIHFVVYLKKIGMARKIEEILKVEGLEGDVYRFSPIKKNSYKNM